MLENIKLCCYTVPTPIQAYSIPAVLTNHDLIAVAQTGEYVPCLPCPYQLTSFMLMDSRRRLWQNCCIPHPHPVKAYGQGQKIGCTTP